MMKNFSLFLPNNFFNDGNGVLNFFAAFIHWTSKGLSTMIIHSFHQEEQ